MLFQTVVASYLSTLIMLFLVSTLGAIIVAIIDGARIECGQLAPHYHH
jgi:hypothetical protein